jgi:hypothetical protein
MGWVMGWGLATGLNPPHGLDPHGLGHTYRDPTHGDPLRSLSIGIQPC